jgi:glycosyltransferase involved in cell wall biosynthesis
MRALAIEAGPDLVYCNDWSTLPIGAAVKAETGARLVYDSHEYAAREHIQNWKWRIVSRAAVVRLEQEYISHADLIITVSDGIADGLHRDHGLRARPTVIRNLPEFVAPVPHVSKPRRQILFHGLIRPERGLEELIDSATAWAFDGEILLRGYGSPGYLALLRARAAARGLTNRLFFAPAVAPVDLIRLAGAADVGYLALPGTTEHYEFALPNKLFEYLMAGLPVLATPRSEIRKVVEHRGIGVISELAPHALATTLNNLTDDQLLGMRRAALEASRTLNWETEQRKLVTAIKAVC